MADKLQKQEQKRDYTLEVIKQMLTLATSGFGLVAALAWNSVIQELVNNYIKKLLPTNSDAVIVTALAVVVTLQLTRIKDELEKPLKPS